MIIENCDIFLDELCLNAKVLYIVSDFNIDLLKILTYNKFDGCLNTLLEYGYILNIILPNCITEMSSIFVLQRMYLLYKH